MTGSTIPRPDPGGLTEKAFRWPIIQIYQESQPLSNYDKCLDKGINEAKCREFADSCEQQEPTQRLRLKAGLINKLYEEAATANEQH